jgi:hypothetical protein
MNKNKENSGIAEVDAEMMEAISGNEAPSTTAVATTDATDITTFTAAAANIKFSYVLVGKGKQTWKVDGVNGPRENCFYLFKDKSTSFLVGEGGAGQAAGVIGIALSADVGWKENPKGPYNPSKPVAPRRFWSLKDVHEAGLSEVPQQVGTYPESGRPIMKAEVQPMCHLRMLLQLPDDFTSMDFRAFRIGEHMYTPVIIEFDKGNFMNAAGNGISQVLATWKERAEFAAARRGEKGYKFNMVGQVCHITCTTGVSRATGFQFSQLNFEAALRDGKLYTFTPEEKADFERVEELLHPSTVTVDEIVQD